MREFSSVPGIQTRRRRGQRPPRAVQVAQFRNRRLEQLETRCLLAGGYSFTQDPTTGMVFAQLNGHYVRTVTQIMVNLAMAPGKSEHDVLVNLPLVDANPSEAGALVASDILNNYVVSTHDGDVYSGLPHDSLRHGIAHDLDVPDAAIPEYRVYIDDVSAASGLDPKWQSMPQTIVCFVHPATPPTTVYVDRPVFIQGPERIVEKPIYVTVDHTVYVNVYYVQASYHDDAVWRKKMHGDRNAEWMFGAVKSTDYHVWVKLGDPLPYGTPSSIIVSPNGIYLGTHAVHPTAGHPGKAKVHAKAVAHPLHITPAGRHPKPVAFRHGVKV